MINTVLFGINIILLYFVWTYALKPSILDHYRDRLFDLRNEVREYYISNNISLLDNTYKSLRDSINSHLRFTEKKSLIKILKFIYELEKDPGTHKYFDQEIDKYFYTKNSRLQDFVKQSRDKSAQILFSYMIFSSPTMLILFLLSAIYFIAESISINISQNKFFKNKAHEVESYSIAHFGFTH